ncbi:hypothetical protein CLAIMM_00414 [Cladophialophora immunda]|nr:hypothetical protein CLAIMM_00414 [Cladophialophora immunda]
MRSRKEPRASKSLKLDCRLLDRTRAIYPRDIMAHHGCRILFWQLFASDDGSATQGRQLREEVSFSLDKADHDEKCCTTKLVQQSAEAKARSKRFPHKIFAERLECGREQELTVSERGDRESK